MNPKIINFIGGLSEILLIGAVQTYVNKKNNNRDPREVVKTDRERSENRKAGYPDRFPYDIRKLVKLSFLGLKTIYEAGLINSEEYRFIKKLKNDYKKLDSN